MNRHIYPCSEGDHDRCPAVDPHRSHIPCVCGCHVYLSLACRLGAHALCDRPLCRCPCDHTTTHERTAARGAWAA